MRLHDPADVEPYLTQALGWDWFTKEHPRERIRRGIDLGFKYSHFSTTRIRSVLKKYGIDDPEDIAMLGHLTHGGCWLCGHANPGGVLCIDHDHKTGLFRGLLCHRCNRVLGQVEDDGDLLSRAAGYVSREI